MNIWNDIGIGLKVVRERNKMLMLMPWLCLAYGRHRHIKRLNLHVEHVCQEGIRSLLALVCYLFTNMFGNGEPSRHSPTFNSDITIKRFPFPFLLWLLPPPGNMSFMRDYIRSCSFDIKLLLMYRLSAAGLHPFACVVTLWLDLQFY